VSDLFLYDDATARTFEPFSLTRPTAELRAGALLLRERWEHALGMRAAGIVTSSHLADFDEPWSVGVVSRSGVLKGGSVLANSRCAVALAPSPVGDVWRCRDRVAAVVLTRDVPADELASGAVTLDSLARKGGRPVDLQGRWMDHVWDFIPPLSAMLTEDIGALALASNRSGAALGIIGGAHPVFAEDGATVEPQVYFDTTNGPVLVRGGATVQAFTRIVGPCVIGRESQVGGDKISGSSIGDICRVHGEVSATIFLGHANKAHDGFVGHSYLGRWVNLGAGTITSNLKNTYGTVQFWTPEGAQETGLQFLGTFFGDHAKTGIGTSLTTGSVIGPGANIYGGATAPRAIPPFAWGERPPYSTYRMDKFIEVARRVMARRHVELSEREMRALAAAYERRWTVDGTR
jgi:UDP-N-acetylglucosamine diphosphorylase / glucose-1-phosphate thymidylyltransferase / UDP-N-acetylgalactosamine diphosphorylase / glucosamine-1-phosphate N-acetyltransferase / galactosamine-1-phosphate N-acetyltransferase